MRAKGTLAPGAGGSSSLGWVARFLTRMRDRGPRWFLIPTVDAVLAGAAWVLVYTARFDFDVPAESRSRLLVSTLVVVAIQVLVNWRTHLARAMWSTSGMRDVRRIVRAAAIGAVLYVPTLYFAYGSGAIPRSAFLLTPPVIVVFYTSVRVAYRELTLSLTRRSQPIQRVLAVCDEDTLRPLAAELLVEPSVELLGLIGTTSAFNERAVNETRVLGSLDDLGAVIEATEPDGVILGLSEHDAEVARIVARTCTDADVDLDVVVNGPGRRVPGTSVLSQLRDLRLEDLLERNTQSVLDAHHVRSVIRGRRILVTGGGGSIGFELVRQIAAFSPAALVVFDNSEYNVYRALETLSGESPHVTVDVVLGDVADTDLVDRAFLEHRPEVVFHAAAYKHVPLLEDQVAAAVRTNVFGTLAVADASARHAVDQFVLISSDKAVRPTSVMGCTKRLAEMVLGALNAGSATTFKSVRFGNVLGSSGSVVPKFREQIANGGPVTVTHEAITRYFMTIPEACELILQALAVGEKDDVLVLDMGEPIKILDLAQQMIRMASVDQDDIEIQITGLRPGEKLYEELFYDHETHLPTEHPRILRAGHEPVDTAWLDGVLVEFRTRLDNGDDHRVRDLIEANLVVMQSADLEVDLGASPDSDAARQGARTAGANGWPGSERLEVVHERPRGSAT